MSTMSLYIGFHRNIEGNLIRVNRMILVNNLSLRQINRLGFLDHTSSMFGVFSGYGVKNNDHLCLFIQVKAIQIINDLFIAFSIYVNSSIIFIFVKKWKYSTSTKTLPFTTFLWI